MHNLELVQMAHAKDKRPAEISGGMKQRVGIARALAMEPKVLLLDEPFGALDALTRAHLQDSVMEIHAQLGNTVMMITHDVDEAVLLSDRIVMMTNGPAARIGEVLDVPLPRPRKRLELVADPTYIRCRQRVLEFLYARHKAPRAAASRPARSSRPMQRTLGLRSTTTMATRAAARRRRRHGGAAGWSRSWSSAAPAASRSCWSAKEPQPPYNRVLLSSLLAGEIGEADIELRPRRLVRRARRRAADGGARSPALRPARREVVLASGDAAAATTGWCWRPAPSRSACRVPGQTWPGVITFRDLADVDGLQQARRRARAAVVIGGGLLGIEAAYGLAKRGLAVTLMHIMARLMERQLDARAARAAQGGRREPRASRCVLEAQTARHRRRRQGRGVVLKDGRMLPPVWS